MKENFAENPTKKTNNTMQENHRKHAGFTLVEVLITLAIVGVVAAITMTSLITNYQKKQTAAHLKQAYSILSNAIMLSVNKNGATNTWVYKEKENDWGYNAKTFYFKYLDEFLQVEQYCGIKHTEFRKGACAKIYALGDTITYSVILKNGIGLSIRSDASATQVEIQLDVNGVKGPARSGRDAFIYRITAKDGLIPVKDDLYGMKACTRTLKNSGGFNWVGWGCSYKIMQNNWEIPDDYPWNEF